MKRRGGAGVATRVNGLGHHLCGAHAWQITEYTITKYTFLIVIVIVMQRPNRTGKQPATSRQQPATIMQTV